MNVAHCCLNNNAWRDPNGFNCYYYELKGICTKTGYYHSVGYYAGFVYNFPELNCCYCGKDDIPFDQAPATTPGRCV
jgi:hypothetical protein